MSDPSLDKALRKFERAEEHVDALQTWTERFCAEHSNAGVIEDDPNTGDCVLRCKFRARPPVLDWGVLIGEALHNFRSGLDYLAWILGGDPPPNPKTSEF